MTCAVIVRVVALTIFWEAAGESLAGKEAVASVIWNRAGGDTGKLIAVCKKPKAFSCWLRQNTRVPNDAPSRRAWRECRTIAERMVNGTFVPSTTATHYHAVSVRPRWSVSMKRVAWIGNHKFYKEG